MTSPTTPRDAITRLSERLRRGHNNSGLSPLDCKIGLDELDALSARMKELRSGCERGFLMTFSQRAFEAAARAAYEHEPLERDDFIEISWDELGQGTRDRFMHKARAALTAALAVDGVALQGWQPMDSAPRDGTEILWALLDTTTVIKWPEYRECFEEGGWWMPLPSPPAASDREERLSPAQEPR